MSFQDLDIIDPLQRALTKEGYTTPTPIQSLAIPHLLKGKDLMGIAQTGTGKTAAFVLPILQRISEDRKAPAPGTPRALVLAPTRELAAQIDQSFAIYGQFLRFRHTVVFGGVSQVAQVKALSQGVDILVATPGRLLDLMNQGYIKLKSVEFFVLDEIDRMLDMGFINDMRKVVSALPKEHQSLFFSATISKEMGKFAGKLLRDPVRVDAAPQADTLESIEQRVFFVDHSDKYTLLLELLEQGDMERTLVFTRTKRGADKVAMRLSRVGVDAEAIHGDKSQNQRTRTMRNFKSGRLQVLVATDIAARGIDVDDISHVVNYDLPMEAESYVHRIGRTGRAGAKGTAYSFCAADERNLLRGIERLTRGKIEAVKHQYHSEKAKNAMGLAAEMTSTRSRSVPKSSKHEGTRKSGPKKPSHTRCS